MLSKSIRAPTWVVVPAASDAERLAAELRWHGLRVCVFPADDGRPYEGLSPHPEFPRDRIRALAALKAGDVDAIVAPAVSLLQGVLPPELLAPVVLQVGQVVDPGALAIQLADLGYLSVNRVEDPGTFSLRGDVLDLWPTGRALPVRLEFFDDELEAVRVLDPERLRTSDPLKTLDVLPAGEVVLGPDALARARRVLREQEDTLGYGGRLRRDVLQDLDAGLRFAGCDAWLPALHPLVGPLDHGGQVVVIEPEIVHDSLETAASDVVSRYEHMHLSIKPLVGPELRYQPVARVLEQLAGAQRIGHVAIDTASRDMGYRANSALRVQGAELAPVVGRLSGWLSEGWRVAVVAETSTRADQVRQLFGPHGLSPHDANERDPERWPAGRLLLLRGDLPRGFQNSDHALALVTCDEIFGDKVRVRRGRAASQRLGRDSAAIESFAQLREGGLVVHERHGIGRFLGLSRVDLGQGPVDMVQLEYRAGDKMYLPVQRLDQLFTYRHTGSGKIKLDKLGGETWGKRKERVKTELLLLAQELLTLQAQRQVHAGHAYVGSTPRFRQFEAAFPYTETPDQARAIDDVLDDLAKPEPMDRLVVGDAGFGKTEVAMRAAFRVILEGRQVCLLCPTAVLAYQHHRTLNERMGPFGVRVGLLSRFGDAAHARALKAKLKAGELDLVVGTTSLLGRGVRYKDLGLIVIDEEHRFGVKQKERLKKLRVEVDCLALSATPIPRSLNQALTGIRGISVISTPPLDRLPVRTWVARFGQQRIREDLMRELQRGGQVFFVHNRVESIAAIARMVAEAVPEATLAVAHGQMANADLETVLVDFVERRADVLVCTAIIESGIDMPNVNTIVVNEADKFGLAALYQLRGRVGRSARRGYCTLMVQDGKKLTRRAMKRMQVLQEHTRLGSGFAVATADLELRGAGDILGQKQHGHIDRVGFETYMRLLEDAMGEARGDITRQAIDPEVEVKRPALIPEAYVPELEERLLWYKRLTSCRSVEQLRRVLDQLESECGTLPDEAHDLGRLLEIKLRCRALGILRAAVLQVRAVFVFHDDTAVEPAAVVALAKRLPRRVKVRTDAVDVFFTPQEAQQPFLFLHWVLDLLEGKA